MQNVALPTGRGAISISIHVSSHGTKSCILFVKNCINMILQYDDESHAATCIGPGITPLHCDDDPMTRAFLRRRRDGTVCGSSNGSCAVLHSSDSNYVHIEIAKVKLWIKKVVC